MILGPEVHELDRTTRGLQRLIVQYNRLRPGDVVMYADLDYSAMQLAMNSLVERRGATVATGQYREPDATGQFFGEGLVDDWSA